MPDRRRCQNVLVWNHNIEMPYRPIDVFAYEIDCCKASSNNSLCAATAAAEYKRRVSLLVAAAYVTKASL